MVLFGVHHRSLPGACADLQLYISEWKVIEGVAKRQGIVVNVVS